MATFLRYANKSLWALKGFVPSSNFLQQEKTNRTFAPLCFYMKPITLGHVIEVTIVLNIGRFTYMYFSDPYNILRNKIHKQANKTYN